jgi:hypothetical protein
MKKLCTILTAVLVLGIAASAFAASEFTNSLADRIADKNANLSGNIPNPPEVMVGGENCGNATPLGVPAVSSGNTCARVNDYDEVCPYTGSTSGDEVYVISGVSGQVTIDLCNSAYDTKVYVYEGSCPGTLIACNDDACNDPQGNPYRSIVSCVNLSASSTYYVVVDGYFGDCGTYNISTYASSGCPEGCDPENCPPGAVLEGEPVCGTNYVDAFNGGCNSTPNVFSAVDCNDVVCGAGGTYTFNGLSYRDTDWYEFNLPIAGNVTLTLCASFESLLYSLDLSAGCGFIGVRCGPTFGSAGTTVSCTYAAPAGLQWPFVATSAFAGVPCGSPYILTIDCGGIVATEATSWGGIKGLYR